MSAASRLTVAGLIAATVALSGCTAAADAADPAGAPPQTPSTGTTAPGDPSAADTRTGGNVAGDCVDYDYATFHALPMPDMASVPCQDPHTAVVVDVWPSTAVTDAGLTVADLPDLTDAQDDALRRADDADRDRCQAAAEGLLGSDFPSRFTTSLYYGDTGSGTVARCDLALLNAVSGEITLDRLPPNVTDALATVDGKYRYASCISQTTLKSIPCGDYGMLLFEWKRAYPAGKDVPYPGEKTVIKRADAFCRSVSEDKKVFYTYPLKDGWTEQPFYRCWLPAARWRSIAEAQERSA